MATYPPVSSSFLPPEWGEERSFSRKIIREMERRNALFAQQHTRPLMEELSSLREEIAELESQLEVARRREQEITEDLLLLGTEAKEEAERNARPRRPR